MKFLYGEVLIMAEAARLIVIGGDAAGLSAASRARRSSKDLEILVFEKGRYISYSS